MSVPADIDPSRDPLLTVGRMHRQDNLDAARAGNIDDLCSSANNKADFIVHCYTGTSEPQPKFIEWQLHNLWHLFCVGAQYLNAKEVGRLVLELLTIRGFGPIIQKGPNLEPVRDAAVHGQKLWTDMPFFVDDVIGYWRQESAAMSRSQRINFCHFFSTLFAVDRSAHAQPGAALALLVLRDALETPRPLGIVQKGEEQQEEGQQQRTSTDDLTVADLLPTVNTFLIKHKLVEWSEGLVIPSTLSAEDQAPGTLAMQAGVEKGGFSPQRWLFWLKRLEEIGSEGADDDRAKLREGSSEFWNEVTSGRLGVAGEARGDAYNMVIAAFASDTSISRELTRQGKKLYGGGEDM